MGKRWRICRIMIYLQPRLAVDQAFSAAKAWYHWHVLGCWQWHAVSYLNWLKHSSSLQKACLLLHVQGNWESSTKLRENKSKPTDREKFKFKFRCSELASSYCSLGVEAVSTQNHPVQCSNSCVSTHEQHVSGNTVEPNLGNGHKDPGFQIRNLSDSSPAHTAKWSLYP